VSRVRARHRIEGKTGEKKQHELSIENVYRYAPIVSLHLRDICRRTECFDSRAFRTTGRFVSPKRRVFFFNFFFFFPSFSLRTLCIDGDRKGTRGDAGAN